MDSGKLMNYLKLRQPTLSIRLSSTMPAMEYLIEFRVIIDCTEYASFADDWQFEHFSSSPYHKQSNGLVEAAVKSAKTLQKKAQRTGRDMWMSFLDYRNTPTEGMDSSPVQRLMLKRTKTTLPLAAHLLEPEIQQDVQTRLTLKRRKAKKHFYPGSKELPDLKIKDRTLSFKPVWHKILLHACVA